MTDNVKKFLEAVSADKELENEIRKALEGVNDPKEQMAVLIESAKANGYELTEEEILPDGQSDALKELSDEELASVAGGAEAGGCGCAVWGYGDGDGLDCGCVALGGGDVDDANCVNSQGGCACVGGGAGATNRH